MPVDYCPSLLSYFNEEAKTDADKLDIIAKYTCGIKTLSDGKTIKKVCCPHNYNYFQKQNRSQSSEHKNLYLLSPKTCGHRSYSGDKIIGYDNITEIGEFPWMALIQYNNCKF